jgi:spore maturation protein SpmB
VLKSWTLSTIVLLAKILAIITGIMVVLGCLNSLGWVEYLIRAFRPVMKVIGLPERTAVMFVTAVIFGLFYGGAVIVEEAKKGKLTADELERLHIAIGINHAMVEDPILFAALGINAFWLVVPRFITAIIAVQTYRAVNGIRGRLFH